MLLLFCENGACKRRISPSESPHVVGDYIFCDKCFQGNVPKTVVSIDYIKDIDQCILESRQAVAVFLGTNKSTWPDSVTPQEQQYPHIDLTPCKMAYSESIFFYGVASGPQNIWDVWCTKGYSVLARNNSFGSGLLMWLYTNQELPSPGANSGKYTTVQELQQKLKELGLL